MQVAEAGDRFKADLWQSLRLWRIWMFLGAQDVRQRFRRSFVGPLWIFVNLSLFVASSGLVYGALLDQRPADFLPYLISGYVIWAYIFASFTEGSSAFISAEGYIKQFSYPKQIYLLRSLVSSTIVLLIGLATVVVMLAALRQFDPLSLLMALVGLAMLMIATLGQIAVSAYLCVKFRDWPHAVAGLLQLVFFVTPIMFPAEMLRARGLAFIYEFNPFFYLIDVVRHPLIGEGMAPLSHYIATVIYATAVWILAIYIARRLDDRVVFIL